MDGLELRNDALSVMFAIVRILWPVFPHVCTSASSFARPVLDSQHVSWSTRCPGDSSVQSTNKPVNHPPCVHLLLHLLSAPPSQRWRVLTSLPLLSPPPAPLRSVTYISLHTLSRCVCVCFLLLRTPILPPPPAMNLSALPRPAPPPFESLVETKSIGQCSPNNLK